MMSLALLSIGLLTGCPSSVPDTPTDGPVPDPFVADPAPESCDAGDEAWVARAMPLLWGRKPHGATEVLQWAQMAREHGRDAVIQAMSLDAQYVTHWREWFNDRLYVARVGDKARPTCFEETRFQLYGGGLAQHIATNRPSERFESGFTMGDVILDSLYADNLAPIYQANLFARMDAPVEGANVSEEELEYNRRVNFGELFFQTYLGRDLGCLPCHNSAFSVTDHPDPALDHTWQLPGRVELALYGNDAGRTAAEIYSVFRHRGVAAQGGGGMRPWGMAGACGRVTRPGNVPSEDFLGQNVTWFSQDLGPSGSVHDVERLLAEGVTELRDQGLQLGVEDSVSAPSAFAYLLATNIADQVWEAATGKRLTIAHYFPRTEAQQQRLQRLADTLATSGFSLRALLADVTSDPYFNLGLRSSCRAQDYGLDLVFDPWTQNEPDAERRRNGVGDAAHRMPSRSLIRTVHSNLGWPTRSGWVESAEPDTPEAVAQEALGVFLRESSPGSQGSDLQGLLAWEQSYGSCGFGTPEAGDIIDRLVERAVAEQATVADLAHAIKDRLTSQALDEAERTLIGGLFGADPDEVVENAESVLAPARLYCGAVLLSPQFQMVSDPVVGWPPRLALGADEDCDRVALLMYVSGTPVSCVDGSLVSGGNP